MTCLPVVNADICDHSSLGLAAAVVSFCMCVFSDRTKFDASLVSFLTAIVPSRVRVLSDRATFEALRVSFLTALFAGFRVCVFSDRTNFADSTCVFPDCIV